MRHERSQLMLGIKLSKSC